MLTGRVFCYAFVPADFHIYSLRTFRSDKSFAQASTCNSHARTHLNTTNEFICPVPGCMQILTTAVRLSRHLRTEHGAPGSGYTGNGAEILEPALPIATGMMGYNDEEHEWPSGLVVPALGTHDVMPNMNLMTEPDVPV